MKDVITTAMFLTGMAIVITALALPVITGQDNYLITGIMVFSGTALAIGSSQVGLKLKTK